jgi:hypothetical protein
MIQSIRALPVGNAVGLQIAVPPGAELVRVLRRLDANFDGPDDPGATIVGETDGDEFFTDISVENGTEYFYRDYTFADEQVLASDPVSITPQASYQDASTDIRDLFFQRLRFGVSQELARQMLRIKAQEDGQQRIAMLTAPPVFEDTRWPVITVQWQSEQPFARGIGETIRDHDDEDFGDTEGWLANHRLEITAWSQNPDERYMLARAVRRILQANLPIFASFGVKNIEWSADAVDFLDGQQFPGPVYVVRFAVSCVAPTQVAALETAPIIAAVDVIPEAVNVLISADSIQPIGG